MRLDAAVDQLTGILAFVRASELRSFAQAARVLDVTASGVGKSVARLEAALGVRLLNRTTRRLSLTDDGAVFFERCRRILDDLDDARSVMSQRDAAVRGRLRVSLPATLGKLTVVPALPGFARTHPEVALEIGLSDRRVSLVEEGIDVALRIGRLDDASLVARPLWQQQVITIASPALLAGGAPTAIGDLSSLPCLSFRFPTTGRERPWLFRTGEGDVVWRPRAMLTVDDGEALVATVAAGLGLSQVPSYMAHDAMRRGDVVEVLADLRPRPVPVSAVYASQRNLPSRIRAFVDWLVTLPGPPPPIAPPRRPGRPGRAGGTGRTVNPPTGSRRGAR
jgi:LysR family transcriptional regulator for bpeEF and oprC